MLRVCALRAQGLILTLQMMRPPYFDDLDKEQQVSPPGRWQPCVVVTAGCFHRLLGGLW
jgi:hypothetical protein